MTHAIRWFSLAALLAAASACSDSGGGGGGGGPETPTVPEQPGNPPPPPAPPPAPLGFSVAGGLPNPVGVAVDPQGNLYLSLAALSNQLMKVAPTGNVLAQVVVPAFGYLAWWPSRNVLLLLSTSGILYIVDPATLAVSPLLDLRTFPVSTQAIYDVQLGDVSSFSGAILPQSSIYGDIAVLERADRTVLFISGVNQGRTHTFVLRLQITGNTGAADVVVSSRAVLTQPPPGLPSSNHQAAGVAVNGQGTVLASIPQDGTFRLVAFSADFAPAAGVGQANRPRVVAGSNVFGWSIGMAADASGNFYVAADVVPTLTVLGPQADRILAQGSSSALIRLREVAVSPDKSVAYLTAVQSGTMGDGALLTSALGGFAH